jgi:hypothetical protein
MTRVETAGRDAARRASAAAPVAAFLAGLLSLSPAAAEDACSAPAAVCATRAAVFPVASFDPFGSAVRVGEDLLVTTRHVVADRPGAVVTGRGGAILDATVVPTGYDGDLVLLRADGLDPGPVLTPAAPDVSFPVYTVAADVGGGGVRVYAEGRIVALPAEGHPLARIQNDAYSQPGNSGGALVDRNGGLVGIVASGGEGRYDAIPAAAIAALKEMSGPAYEAAHTARGAAYRKCIELIEPRRGVSGPLPDDTARDIVEQCQATGNRQLLENAGQVLGLARRLADSIDLLEEAVAQDPNAMNSRLSLVVSLQLAGRFVDELPHLRVLVDRLPDDPQVLRFAVQAGKWGGDEAFAEAAYDRLETAHPELAPPARRFLDSDAPPPLLPPPK